MRQPAWKGPLSPELVDPSWRAYWKDLRVASLLNERGPDFFLSHARPGVTVGSNVSLQPAADGLSVFATSSMTTRGPTRRITVSNVLSGDQPAPPATFATVVSNVTADAVDTQYSVLGSYGGIFWSGGYTAYHFALYNRDASNDHRIVLYNRSGATLRGTSQDAPVGYSGYWASGETPRLLVARWNADDTIEFWIDSTYQGSFTNGAWQSGTGTTPLQLLDSSEASSTEYALPGKMHVFYQWGRGLTDPEIRRLAGDPYGPLRPRSWGPELSVGATVSLYATADGTLTTLVDEADATTNIYTSIDDDPASPTDSDWINNSIGTGTGFFDLTNMPGTFATADSATIVARYRGQNFGSGTVTLYAQLFQSDETTSLSNEVQVAQVTGNGSFADTSAVTITGINTSANKAVWDGARVRFRWATT